MKTSSSLTIFVFILVIIPLAVGFLLKPADSFSPEEQRKLQQFPEFKTDEFLDGTFSSKINSYMNDQFPLRDVFVGAKSVSESLLLKRENNGVLRGDNDQLAVRLFAANDGKVHPLSYSVPKTDLYYDEVVADAAEALSKLSAGFAEHGIDFAIMLPPRTVDVAASAFAYPDERSVTLTNRVSELLSGLNYIDMAGAFRARFDAGEYVYYRTDHHWTALGAYYAYVEVMKSFGEQPHDIAEFERKTVSESFLGSTYSKAGYKDITPDRMEVFELPSLPSSSFVTERPYDKELPRIDGLYKTAALSEKDKYPLYLGGTTAYARVSLKSGEKRETLMILGDSFALSLAPMLALHYDIEFVRLGDWSNVFAADGAPDADKVLVVWNFENLITTTDLSRTRGIVKYYGE